MLSIIKTMVCPPNSLATSQVRTLPVLSSGKLGSDSTSGVVELGVMDAAQLENATPHGQTFIEFSEGLRAALDTEPNKCPSMLYHYTTAKGLEGILKTGKVWATNYAFMNDPAELVEGSTIIKNVVKEVDGDLIRVTDHLLHSKGYGTLEEMKRRHTYLASFSKHGDTLSQWILYGDGGRGFSIGFDLSGIPCRRVYYNQDALKKETKELLVTAQNLWEQAAKKHGTLADDECRGVCGAYLMNIMEWACRYKNRKWKHEKEWRLRSETSVFFGIAQEAVSVRVRGSQLVPYREINLWDTPEVRIRRIVLGPLQDVTTGRFAVEALWELNRLKRPPEKGEDADSPALFYPNVVPSAIKYRQT